MKFASVAVAFNEERFIGKHLKHIPDWVEKKLVLVSKIPWEGEPEPLDKTAEIASQYAQVVEGTWATEHEQRNTGQMLNEDCDWVIILDPDEFLSNENWDKLKDFLENTSHDAVIIQNQRVFWKDKEVSPCNDYQQLIAVRPYTRFVDKRIINTSYTTAPVELLHFSWSRTDKEVWSKISHYAHAHDFDIKKWYEEVWLAGKTENLHPVSPEALGRLTHPILPKEIEGLDIWQGL